MAVVNPIDQEQLKKKFNEQKALAKGTFFTKGDATAQFYVGCSYEEGNGVEIDLKKAMKWYKKAISQGNVLAKRKLKDLQEKLSQSTPNVSAPLMINQKPLLKSNNNQSPNISNSVSSIGDKGFHELLELANQGNVSNVNDQRRLGIMYSAGKGVAQSDKKAFDWYQKAALQGDAFAQCMLGLMYDKGRGVAKSDKKAFDWYQKAALQGNADAKFYLSFFKKIPPKHLELCDKQREEYIQQQLKLAEEGNAAAQTYIGWAYQTGTWFPKSYKKALGWYIKAAEQNVFEVELQLAIMNEEGQEGEDGIPIDLMQALIWYEKSASHGNIEAKYKINDLNGKNRVMLNDKQKEEYIQQQLKLAEEGNAAAQTYMGRAYQSGAWLPKDLNKVKELYHKAAFQGNACAQYELGLMYIVGQGVVQSYTIAITWLEKASNQEHYWAQYTLNVMYYSGKGTAQDYTKAFAWFQKTAHQGKACAQFKLGIMYGLGLGVAQNTISAITMLEKAAFQSHHIAEYLCSLDSDYFSVKSTHGYDEYMKEHNKNFIIDRSCNYDEFIRTLEKAAIYGYPRAQFYLGLAHSGRGKVQNCHKAFKYFQQAASQGFAPAQYLVGILYTKGRGVTQNYGAAFTYFQKAADQGNARAKCNLGLLCETGLGMSQSDLQQALKWYQEAADQGNDYSKTRLKELQEKLNQASMDVSASLVIKNSDHNINKEFQVQSFLINGGDIEAQTYVKPIRYGKNKNNHNTFVLMWIGEVYRESESSVIEKDYFELLKELDMSSFMANLSNKVHPELLDPRFESAHDKQREEYIQQQLKLAEGGNAAAQTYIGRAYQTGTWFPQDYELALEWYQKAAAQHASEAELQLGIMYEEGNGVSIDIKQAMEWYQLARSHGNVAAQDKIKGITEKDTITFYRKQHEEYIEQLLKAAQSGNAHAQYQLGIINGKRESKENDNFDALKRLSEANEKSSIEKDYLKVLKSNNDVYLMAYNNISFNMQETQREEYIEQQLKWAEGGNAAAQTYIGRAYQTGTWFPQDYELALEWYQKAAAQHASEAELQLGIMYEEGSGVSRDERQALEWYKISANHGNVEAKERIENISDKVGPTLLDEWQEKYIVQKLNSAQNGNAADQYYIGWFYQTGTWFPQDYQKALGWYQKAADQGHSGAKYNLGIMNDFIDPGIIQSDVEALRWLQKVDERTDADETDKIKDLSEKIELTLENTLASINSIEEKTFQEQVALEKTYQEQQEQVALRKKNRCSAHRFYLGVMYASGRGVAKNDKKAFDWFKMAAEPSYYYEEGDARAQCELGFIYADGRGIEQSDVRAFEWFEKAANLGYARAQFYLGFMYGLGRGVVKDNATAIAWIQRAAIHGYFLAKYCLKVMHKNGDAALDYSKMLEHIQKAASQGNAEAEDKIKELSEKIDLTSEEISIPSMNNQNIEPLTIQNSTSEDDLQFNQLSLSPSSPQNSSAQVHPITPVQKLPNTNSFSLEAQLNIELCKQMSISQETKEQQESNVLEAEKHDLLLERMFDNLREQNQSILSETQELRQEIAQLHLEQKQKMRDDFEQQNKDFNFKMSTLQQELLQLSNPETQTKLEKLQAEHNLLMQEYRDKQQVLEQQQHIEQCEELRLFYRSLQGKLQEFFLACKALDSGMVERKKNTTNDKIAKSIELAGEIVSLSFISSAFGLLSKLIQLCSDVKEERRAATVSELAVSFAEIDRVTEQTARELTQRYEEQIRCLDNKGAKILGECGVKYILAYISGKQLKKEEPLVPQLVNSVTTIKTYNGWWPNAHKTITTLDQKKNSKWKDNEIFKRPGIITEKGGFFSGKDTNPKKYGYRLGSEEEAIEAGLKQTQQRISSSTQVQQSQLSQATHHHVVTIVAATQTQAEQLELLQKQLKHETDARIKEAKENAIMKVEMQQLNKQFQLHIKQNEERMSIIMASISARRDSLQGTMGINVVESSCSALLHNLNSRSNCQNNINLVGSNQNSFPSHLSLAPQQLTEEQENINNTNINSEHYKLNPIQPRSSDPKHPIQKRC